MVRTVHIAVYDTFADWEVGYAAAAINRPLWHAHPGEWEVRTVGLDLTPITTLGGFRVVPDLVLADVTPETSALLILPGNDLWPDPAWDPWLDLTRELLAAAVPVAAICGATGGLARAGLLDDRPHTSNALEFLQSVPGYSGSEHYRDQPAVDDGLLITGAAQAPVDFAKAILGHLGVYTPDVLESWFTLYGRQDPAGFYELMATS